jgi:glycosyltransferase involved in cell wall biosynthesis
MPDDRKVTTSEGMEGINMTAMVSIIINNFNYDQYIASCIESALAQTYRNIEVIVSDDGSTDNSKAVIESFGTSIIANFKSNGGQASALNAGFRKSTGNLVIFLDADDLLKPHCVAEIVRHWHPDLMKLHFNLEVIDAAGKAVGCLYMKQPLPRGDLRESLLTSGTVASMGMSGNVFARTFLEQVMPMPEVGWERGADTYLFNLATLTGQVGAIDEALGGYRVHGKNVSAKVKKGNVNKQALRKFLQREILTDQSLNDYGRKIGVNYRLGTLTGSLPHIQQLFLHEKLYREDRCFGDINLRRLFVLYMKLLVTVKDLLFYKKPIIATWSLAIVLLPKVLAERVMVSGYRHGLVLAATKVLSRSQAKFSVATALGAAGALVICLAAWHTTHSWQPSERSGAD